MRVSQTDAQQQLRDALERAGFDTARMKGLPVLDGQRHSAPLKEDRGPQQGGCYRAHYNGTRPAGAWWNHRTGDVGTWKAEGKRVAISPEEAGRIARKQAAQAVQRERDLRQRENNGAREAERRWAAAKPASSSHPYLSAKGVDTAGIRQDTDGRLVVPLQADGKLVNLLTITADGAKRRLYGARKTGAHFIIGEIAPGRPIAFAEGLATAKSIHEATGFATVMTMDSGNLAPVAEAIRKAHPNAQFVFAADNDAHLAKRAGARQTPNVRVENALAAAANAGNAIVLTAPELPQRSAADRSTDWNNVAAAQGPEAMRATLRTMIASHTMAQEQARQAAQRQSQSHKHRGPRLRM